MQTALVLKRILVFSLTLALLMPVMAQRKPKNPAPAPVPTPSVPVIPGSGPNAMPSGNGSRSSSSSGPKAYNDVITDKAQTMRGLFTVHKVDEKYFFEIPDSIMKREIMAITRFTKVAAGAGIYGGELANQQVIQFEKGPDNKLFLRVTTLVSVANDSSQPIYKAVRNSNVDPIAVSFDIKALSNDSSDVVIDVTEFFKGDNQPVSLSANAKRRLGLGGLASDRSYLYRKH